MWARIIPGIIGSIMILTAFNWIIDPSSAAAGLSMSLLQGEGTAGIMAIIGAYRNEHIWIYATVCLLGSAAIFRIYAGLMHGTEFLMSAIFFEILTSILLIISLKKIKSANQ